MAGSALKLVGVLVVIRSYPVILVVLILSSIISLYYYLSIFIRRITCLGSSNYRLSRGVLRSKGLMALVISIMALNWLGGFPLFLLCGGLIL